MNLTQEEVDHILQYIEDRSRTDQKFRENWFHIPETYHEEKHADQDK